MKKKAFIACQIMSAPAVQKCFSMFIVPFDCTTDLHLNDNCYLFPSLANKNLCLGCFIDVGRRERGEKCRGYSWRMRAL
jgi:hypothetical protein